MALPLIVAGAAVRYGAKKLLKHLTKQAIKQSKSKDAIKKAQKTKKNLEIHNHGNIEKASWKKVYRGAREMDGSYTDPGNTILRTRGKVNIGLRPIGKNPQKVKNEMSPFSGLTSTTKKQQAPNVLGPAGSYKSPTKRFNQKDIEMAVSNAMKKAKELKGIN